MSEDGVLGPANERRCSVFSAAEAEESARRGASVGPVKVVAEKVVGIDLGTTNSAVAAMEGGKAGHCYKFRGTANHAVRGSVHEDRGFVGRADCKAPGRG
ncbi:unnamed protein product [Thlaspi arvense]|uniref:Heat shock protein 70 n=1 Tax=Thlaspi arvense TaxID=13288 RepID=A0AAU9SHW3_THLAR|nr:unnamed protein product [Thlaspi arvense]